MSIFTGPNRYAFGYLIGASVSLAIWGLIFWRRADLRREMVVMSCVAVLIGLPHEYLLWTRDWWHPPTLTHTRIGVEDLIYAIATGGTLAAIYAFVTRTRLVARGSAPRRVAALAPLAIDFIVPLPIVGLLGWHSFIASAIGVGGALAWILLARPELIRIALASALLGVLASLPCYWIMEGLLPGFIAAAWDLPRLSGVRLAAIPIEDLIWYAYTAALFGTYYKYAAGLGRP
jgi:hypothetical protein